MSVEGNLSGKAIDNEISVEETSQDTFSPTPTESYVLSDHISNEKPFHHNAEHDYQSESKKEEHVLTLESSFVTSDQSTVLPVVSHTNNTVYVLVQNDSEKIKKYSNVGSYSSEDLVRTSNLTPSSLQMMDSGDEAVNIIINGLLSTSTITSTTMTYNTTNSSVTNLPTTLKNVTSMLNLSSSILSTTVTSMNMNPSTEIVLNESPHWTTFLSDCKLIGDTYTGYVLNESQMEATVNMYKKETLSLFSVRQTPPNVESSDTIRLMWKSHYVPFDGIPFVNIGRRATVYECEHGPRKRSSAIKRMRGMENTEKKLVSLTCPARLFVKKVRKFPQYKVPVDSGPKVLRQLQEQALKHIRENGFEIGETRLYMHLPLTSVHRYHRTCNPGHMFPLEIEKNTDETLSVDSRVLKNLQYLVRQGFNNPFLVRTALKDFVANKMTLEDNERIPEKHNKAFYPPMIEIQNLIHQTEVTIQSGQLSTLPAPAYPPVPPRNKKKRTNISHNLLAKKLKADDITQSTSDSNTGDHNSEVLSVTLSESQLEHISLTNFSYEQLAQLAKIGLLALNNATREEELKDDNAVLMVAQNRQETNT